NLKSIPTNLSMIKSLEYIDLSYNKLKTIPREVFNIKSLKDINLYANNELVDPPIEIASKGIKAIRNYYKQLDEEGIDYLYEAKLIIIGEPEAGKTTLTKKIINRKYKLNLSEDTTKGINLVKWCFKSKRKINFKINIWDFGGQEIYHATHQFFLTKNSLYILLVDSRKEDTDFYYWLNTSNLLSKNSPIIIVNNEKNDRRREIPLNKLKSEFDNIQDNVYRTNLATNRGLDNIINIVKLRLSKLPHIGTPLPITWIKVREYLESDKRNYIYSIEYFNLCEKYGFKEKTDKLQLSEYLHDIGVILHFQNIQMLKKIVILKPEWVTKSVYKILDDNTIIDNFGKFNFLDIERIWSSTEYDDMHDELLVLMTEFKLCYRIPNKCEYIAPQLLKENPPEINCIDNNCINLYYEYKFMPKGILSKLIVSLNMFIFKNKVWKSGVVFYKNKTYAQLSEYYNNRKLKICISGKHKKELLSIIRHEIDNIHNAYSKLPNFDIFIPCICFKCTNEKMHYYTYAELSRYIEYNKDTIECRYSFENIKTKMLIDDYYCKDSSDEKFAPKNNYFDKISINNNGDIFFSDTCKNETYNFNKNKGLINIAKDKSNINSIQNINENIFKNLNWNNLIKELNLLKIKLAEDESYDEAKLIKHVIESNNSTKLLNYFKTLNNNILQIIKISNLETITILLNKISK
ncbi:MAG: COR domain-containing protein, partial [Clostridiales bacterium]